ncbi:MAG: type II toxin-antitoxin system Phd/YefM family antitoxin, partial [Solirubrobacteraceae bacterium]
MPQRELRNNVRDVLRRAASGERFTITVAGRPVAELEPPGGRDRAATLADLQELLDAMLVDARWVDEHGRWRDDDPAAGGDPYRADHVNRVRLFWRDFRMPGTGFPSRCSRFWVCRETRQGHRSTIPAPTPTFGAGFRMTGR